MSIIVALLSLAGVLAGLGFAVHVLWLIALMLLVLAARLRAPWSPAIGPVVVLVTAVRSRLSAGRERLAQSVHQLVDQEDQSIRVPLADLLAGPKGRDEEYIEP